METGQALKIVQALAAGVDPESGEALDAASVCRRPQNVIALNRALSALVYAGKRERNRPAKAGHYWSREEEAKVCEQLRLGIDFHQIAKGHGRSVSSIVARLVKLGRIAVPQSKAQD